MAKKDKTPVPQSQIVYGYTEEDILKNKQYVKYHKMYNLEKLLVFLTLVTALVAGGIMVLLTQDGNKTIMLAGLGIMTVLNALSLIATISAASIAFGIKMTKKGFTALGVFVFGILVTFLYYGFFGGILTQVLPV